MNTKINFIVKVGVFSAIAFLLQVLGSIMSIKVAGFLEVEFSDLPAIILSFALGPLAGVLVELIKNLLHLTMTSTGGVGELANFVINGSSVFVCGYIYSKNKTKKNAVVALIFSVITLVFFGFFANLYIMLPLYMANADFTTKFTLTAFTISPFNLCKGTVIACISMLIYKKIARLIK